MAVAVHVVVSLARHDVSPDALAALVQLAAAAACSLAVAEVGFLFEELHAEESVVAWRRPGWMRRELMGEKLYVVS